MRKRKSVKEWKEIRIVGSYMQSYSLSRAEEDVLTMIIEQETRIGPGRSENLPTDRYDPIVLIDIITGLDRKGYITSTCDLSSAGAMLTHVSGGKDYCRAYISKERSS